MVLLLERYSKNPYNYALLYTDQKNEKISVKCLAQRQSLL